MSNLRENKKAKIRNEILRVSKDAFLENGYENTTTKEIARRAEIGSGTLFNYFPTKADILIEIISSDITINQEQEKIEILKNDAAEDVIYRYIEKFLKPLTTLPANMIKEFSIASLTVIKNRSQILSKIIDIDIGLMHNLATIIQELKLKGLISNNRDSALLAKIIFSTFFFDMMLYIFDERINKNDVIQNIKDSISVLI